MGGGIGASACGITGMLVMTFVSLLGAGIIFPVVNFAASLVLGAQLFVSFMCKRAMSRLLGSESFKFVVTEPDLGMCRQWRRGWRSYLSVFVKAGVKQFDHCGQRFHLVRAGRFNLDVAPLRGV